MAYRLLVCAAFTGTGALALGLAAPAADAAEPNGWYVGAARDNTHVEVWRGLGWEVGGDERGVSLLAGWEVSRRFSLELGAMRAGGLQWTEYLTQEYLASHTTFDARALHASGVVTFGRGKAVEAYLKAGLARYRLDGRQVLDTLLTDAALTRDVDASGADSLLGGGIGFRATPKWRVRIEYQWFGVDADFLGVSGGDDPTIDSFSIGVDYRLGRPASVNSLH